MKIWGKLIRTSSKCDRVAHEIPQTSKRLSEVTLTPSKCDRVAPEIPQTSKRLSKIDPNPIKV